jgi:hypothetical protein
MFAAFQNMTNFGGPWIPTGQCGVRFFFRGRHARLSRFP